MVCKSYDCIVWYEPSQGWTKYTDCRGDCRCPIEDLPPPPPGEPIVASMLQCVGKGKGGVDDPITPEVIFTELKLADSWLMQQHCEAFCDIGCEVSRGDGIVKRIGFNSSKYPEPRYQVLQGDRPELVIFGGMADGSPNIANGLPDPWIIGYAELKFPEKSQRKRINVAGFTSFNVEEGNA